MTKTSLIAACVLMTACPRSGAEQLTVDIAGIEAAEGHMMIAVHATQESWESETGAVAELRTPVRERRLSIVVEDLAPGTHAVMLFHDRNDNGRLDRNMLGIPSEGFGFSNNPNTMGRPSFEESSFELSGEQRLRIELR